MATIMALDLGQKKTGVALTDPLEIIARPLTVFQFKSREELLVLVKEVIEKHEVYKVVVGLPYGNDGEMTTEAYNIVRVTKFLQKRLKADIQWVYQEEILSTRESLHLLIESGASKKKRRQPLDKFAAVQILQRYLEKREVK